MNRFLGMVVATAAFATLAASYPSGTGWASWAALALVAAVWLSEPWHRQHGVVSIGFSGFVVLTAFAALNGLSSVLLLSALTLALAGWDLLHFAQFLDQTEEIDRPDSLIRKHWQRLGLVLGSGWLLGLVLLNVRVRINLTWALLLGLLALVGLSRLIRRMRRESG